MTQFVEQDLELLQEGRVLQQFNEEFARLQGELIRFRREHGDKADGAKGKLILELNICCEKMGQETFSILPKIKLQMPPAPMPATIAIGDEDQTGQGRLFCRRSGSTTDNPHQQVLCTQDGRALTDEQDDEG